MKKRNIWILVILAGLAAMFYINRKAKSAEVTAGGGGGVGGAGGSGPLPTGSRPGAVLRAGSNQRLVSQPEEEEVDPGRAPLGRNKRSKRQSSLNG
jgi:hypothetical protein